MSNSSVTHKIDIIDVLSSWDAIASYIFTSYLFHFINNLLHAYLKVKQIPAIGCNWREIVDGLNNSHLLSQNLMTLYEKTFALVLLALEHLGILY